MKPSPTNSPIWLIFLGLFTALFVSNPLKAQLKGSYTIDGSSAASASNYKTFGSAISDMVSGTRADGGTANGKGVSGAVTFNVLNGTYMEQNSLAAVSGASATNTITFQSKSGDSSKVILVDSTSASATANYTLELNAAKYITIKHITISRPGTKAYGIAVALTANTKYINFIGDLLIGKVDPSTSTAGIVAGNAVINSTGADSFCTFSGNHFKNGYNSMALTGTSYGYNNTITNNIFDTAGMAGVYTTNLQTNMIISGNIFNMGPFANFSGHYISYGVRLESAINFKVLKNRFYATSGASVSRCIVMFTCTSTTGNRNLIANNFAWVSAGSTSSTGITLGGNSNLDIVYNNVLMTSVPSASAALYVYPQYVGSSNIILNNNLINKGTGTAIDNSNVPATSGYSTGVTRCNYNNLYTKGSYIGNYQGNLYSSISSWQSSTNFDSNSVNLDPGYTSNTDLHVSSSGINNKGLPYTNVTDDIDGDTRNATTPDIGADEFTPTTLDAGITSLDSPAVFCAPKTANVIVRFTNFGQNTLTSLKINWSVNGTTQTAYSWSGSLATGLVSSSVSIGTYTFSAKTPYTVKVWTSLPNGSADQKASNDTLLKSIASGLSGSYTIGGTSPDFKSFNDALDAITLRGLCGATVFNVRNGTYNEQLSIPNYPSLSAINTLTFQSEKGDSSKVIITQASVNANGVNNVVIQMNGCRYVTIKQITILRTGAGIYQSAFEIKGKSTNNSLLNNAIIGVKLTAANATGDVISSTADKDTSNTFKNNLIRYGNMGINISGDAANHESNNLIDGNIIDSTYSNGINVTYNDLVTIRNNAITHTAYGNSSFSGMVLNSSNGAIKVTGNKIYMPYGGSSGVSMVNCVSKSGSEGLIANNYISATKGAYIAIGLYDTVSNYQNFYYNSINQYSSPAGVDFYANASNISLKDNMFHNNGGGYAINIVNTSGLSYCNYNDLSSVLGNIGIWGGTKEADLASWQSASSMDANSISINPTWLSNTDYHTSDVDVHGKGSPIAGITTDIDGHVRSTTKPCMGALEFKTPKNEAGIYGLGSPTTICQGTNSIVANLRNSGSDTLKTCTINWSIGGAAQTPYSFSGKIKPDSTAAITIGSYSFSSGFVAIKVWSSSPNGKTDSFPANDTFTTTLIINAAPTANVGSSKTICSGTNTTIGAAAVSGDRYSWTSRPAGFVTNKANPTISPLLKTTYILTETNSTGCASTDSAIISVIASPTASVGKVNNTVFCYGDSTRLGSSATAGYTYSWKSVPAGFTSTLPNPAFPVNLTADYILTVTATNGCTAKDSVKLTSNPLPNATVIKPITVCSGNTITVGGTAVTGDTYFWTDNGSSGFTSTSSNPSVSPTTTTKYTLVEKITLTGCSKINSTTVTVVNTPTVGTIIGATTVCSGQTIVYAPSVTTNGVTYSYKPSFTTGTTTSTNGDSLKVHWASSGVASMWVIAKVTSGTCKDSEKISFNINPIPTARFSAKEVCFGQATGFTNASTNAIATTWDFGDGDTLTANNPNHIYKAPGIYPAKLLALNSSGCYDSAFVNVKVDSLPRVAFKVAPNICMGNPVQFTYNGTPSAKSYIWDFGDGNTSNAQSPGNTFNKAGTYKVVLTVVNNTGCSDTLSHNVIVTPPPSGNFTMTQGSGRLFNFIAKDTTLTKYVWDFGDTTGGVSGFKQTHTYSGDNTYTVKLSETNGSGCTASHDSTIKVKYNTGIEGIDEPGLAQMEVYPNPFSNKTMLSYAITQKATVKIVLTDITGKQIAELKNGVETSGAYTLVIDADNYHIQPGMYFINLVVNGVNGIKRIVKME